eukprot:TRINITY_DN109606_c0_g1_i1.p3 TRINITY_DN109606_c0_g1~~TRINITY_DN109606_c0_g1_i1.p3  ORF type:complete len:134 (-),score=0.80 TRINITY_DN109606_c0_g1_i1:155-556(-)
MGVLGFIVGSNISLFFSSVKFFLLKNNYFLRDFCKELQVWSYQNIPQKQFGQIRVNYNPVQIKMFRSSIFIMYVLKADRKFREFKFDKTQLKLYWLKISNRNLKSDSTCGDLKKSKKLLNFIIIQLKTWNDCL